MSVKGGIILAIILLVGMFVAARVMLDSSSATPPNKGGAGNTEAANEAPNSVVCWGNFDVEPGINRALYPKQMGDIVEVAKENTRIKKGDVLLQVNDKMAQIKVRQAEAAVKAATAQLDQAKKLPEFYATQIEAQTASVNNVLQEIKELEKKRDIDVSRFANEPSAKTTAEFYAFGLAKLAEKKKGEDAKLKQIKLQDADLKIKEAEADLEAKNFLVAEATESLTYFRVVAPQDGYLLRVGVKKGEILSPNPMQPAFEFMPDLPIIVRAEVLQEWGRYVKVGQSVDVEDDVYHGPKWKGKIKTLSKWYAPIRTPVIEPFRYNDVRTMECIIELEESKDKDMPPPRIGQRVRAKIKIEKAP